eukprot:179914-Hanusia_phi.AAC.2
MDAVLDSPGKLRESSTGEGGRHESIPHRKRDAVDDQVQENAACVRLCSADLQSCEKLLAFSNVTLAFLSDNKIHFIEPLAALPNLRLLDLSSNMVQFCSGQNGKVFFPKLNFIFLHNNLIRKLSDIQSLERANVMRVLTIFGNPIEGGKIDVIECLARFPSLLLVDNQVRADHFKEHEMNSTRVDSRKVLKIMLKRRFKSRLQRKVDHIFEIFRDPNRNIHDFYHFKEIHSQVHRIYSNSTPFEVINRVATGHSARKKFRVLYSRYLMPAITLQRWLLSAYLRRLVHSLLSGGILDHESISKKLAMLPLADDDLLHHSSNLTLFFPPKYANVIEQLAAKWGILQSSSASPILYLSNVFSFQQQHDGQANGMFRSVLRMHRRARSLQDAHPWARFQVKRFGMGRLVRCDTKTKIAFHRQFEEHDEFDELQSSRPDRMFHNFLVVLKFRDETARNHFINYVSYLNRTIKSLGELSIQPVSFLLGEGVMRIYSTCCIQATVRRWLECRGMRNVVKKAVLLLRCTKCIQHWWRWTALRLRIIALASLAKLLNANASCTTLYCISDNLKQKLVSHDHSVSFLPESKFSFVFDENEDVQILEAEASPSRNRGFLPAWVGLQVDPIPWFPHDASLKSLLTQGTQIDIAEPRGQREEEEEPLLFPNRRLFGSIPVLKFHFKSSQQARIRASLLFIKTWSSWRREPITLMRSTDCQQHLMAALLQSVYRGHLSRSGCKRLRLAGDMRRVESVSRKKFVEVDLSGERRRRRKELSSFLSPPRRPPAVQKEISLTGMTALDGTRGNLKEELLRSKQSLAVSARMDKIAGGRLCEEALLRSRRSRKPYRPSQSRVFSSPSRVLSSDLELFTLSKLEASVVVSLKEVELQQVRNRIKTTKERHQHVMEIASENRRWSTSCSSSSLTSDSFLQLVPRQVQAGQESAKRARRCH